MWKYGGVEVWRPLTRSARARHAAGRLALPVMLLSIAILALVALLAVINSESDSGQVSDSIFRRAPGDVTRITVGPPEANGQIDPRLFSNFLEHLGGTIYDGLWANVVANPQFEADKRGSLARWSRTGAAKWADSGLFGRRMALERGGAVSQLITLPIHRQQVYRGSLFAMLEAGSSARLDIHLRIQEKPAVIASAQVSVGSNNWKSHNFELRIPEGSIGRGEPVEIRIECAEGAATLDMVEIFPADHIDGVDPDVMRLSKDLRIELLRWPGGNFVSGYRWKDGIGPREKRPTKPNPAWAGLETHHFGTDEFMAFCRRIGAKPQICVNAGDGTPEEAADWVDYCNGSPDTAMGRLRANNGHREPYNVRVWEIGNELYGDWQIGHTDAAGNAERFLRFRDAMLKRDPTIEIIATGRGDVFQGAELQEAERWNESLLKAADANNASPDYLSLHPLVPLPHDVAYYEYDQVFESITAHPTWWCNTYIPALQSKIQNPKSKIAVTEWGLIVGGPQWLKYPNHDEQSGAVYAALFFNAMIRRSESVKIANVTALMHGGGIKRPNQFAFVDPMYHVQKFYGVARPHRKLSVKVEGPATDVPARGFLPAVKNVPMLDVIAAESAAGPLIFIVNRDVKKTRPAEIRLPKTPASITAEQLSAPARTRNRPEKPNAVKPKRIEVKATGRSIRHDFPPCSVTLIRWK